MASARKGIGVRRRHFITLLGGAATWPLALHAQQPAKVARIGFLGTTTQSAVDSLLKRFRAGLRDLGYVEGKNILIDFRWAEGNYARLEEFATELIHLGVDVLVTHGTPGTLAAKRATTTVPIVMVVSGDAVATGIVASLARPVGNVTGSTFFDPELSAKRLEFIKDAFPAASRIGVLLNPDNPVTAAIVQAMGRTANSLKLELQLSEVGTSNEIESALSTMLRARVDAVAITTDALLIANYARIAEIAANNRLASIGEARFTRAGGLIGYSANIEELWYRGAYFVDKILKGAKPANLPVEQPTKFELVINVRTARAVGVEVPRPLLLIADDIIE
jgi:putative tryptophan/tyrosine transport system substrate-binding protein